MVWHKVGYVVTFTAQEVCNVVKLIAGSWLCCKNDCRKWVML